MGTRFFASFQPMGQNEPTDYFGVIHDGGMIEWDDNDIPKYVISKVHNFLKLGIDFYPDGERMALGIGIHITKVDMPTKRDRNAERLRGAINASFKRIQGDM